MEGHKEYGIISEVTNRISGIKKAQCAVGIKRSQYAIIILACTVVLIFQCAKCAEKYMNKSTGTADKYVHVSKTAFPELTICPTYPYKDDRLSYHGVDIVRDLQVMMLKSSQVLYK